MQRVSRTSAVPSLPAPPASPGAPGYFTGGNPGLGQGATTPGYEWFNAVQEELMAVIARGGLTASPSDLAQVRKSLDRLFGGSLSSYATNATLSVNEAGLVNVDASGGARVITLPPVNALGGRPIRFQIVKADGSANTVTVQLAAGDVIIGLSSIVLSAFGDSVTLVSDGGITWVPIQGFGASPTRRGLTRYATPAEVASGTPGDMAVTPAGLGALLTGMIAFFPTTSAPTGWLKANGALVSRATFFNLWAVAQASGNLVTDAAWVAANGPTGAFSQGDGSTTFRIPDLRGEFLRGLDDGRGVDSGRGIGTFQDGQLLSHGHAITDPTHAHGVAGNNGGTAGIVATHNVANDTAYFLQTGGTNQMTTAASSTGITIANTGGAENRPRNIALLACIKF